MKFEDVKAKCNAQLKEMFQELKAVENATKENTPFECAVAKISKEKIIDVYASLNDCTTIDAIDELYRGL